MSLEREILEMKTKKISLVLLAFSMIAAGCSSDYVISTNDGHMMTTHGKPEKTRVQGLFHIKILMGMCIRFISQTLKKSSRSNFLKSIIMSIIQWE